jgi:hypothetical protein
MRSYQPSNSLVKERMVICFQILTTFAIGGWNTNQLLTYVRLVDIHIAEPLVSDTGTLVLEIAIADSNQIAAEPI